MIVLKCRYGCKCVKYVSLRGTYRRCCSKAEISDVSDSELVSKRKHSSICDPNVAVENVKAKIVYSSAINRNHFLSWKGTRLLMRKQADEARRERFKMLEKHLFPIAMKYMQDFTMQNQSSVDDSTSGAVTVPLGMVGNTKLLVPFNDVSRAEASIAPEMSSIPATLSTSSSIKAQHSNELLVSNRFKRNVSCGGCGAQIQCEDQYNPGFIPLEFLSSVSNSQLRLLLCQRCYLTRSLKVSLQVNFNPFSYLNELNKLKSRQSLILGVFDVTDISHTICSSISDFIGKRHPVILVGNKVDLLPPDKRGYLNRVRNCIKEIFQSNGHLNIKEVFLVSSVSGIGIEDLITKLFSIWNNYGDIYLVGHTNVGKSSLFNALLTSDLCKPISSAGTQTATTSPWPGTTLGILKFPLSNPAGKFMFFRTKRIQSEHMERKFTKMEESTSKHYKGFLASSDTFSVSNIEDINCETGTTAVNRTIVSISREKLVDLGLPTARLRDGIRWCHDTPGIPHSERTLDLLTPAEMRYAVPGPQMIIPRTFYFKVGLSLFIGGMARLDYNDGDHPICMTVFASNKLPVLVCKTADAEELYASLLGTQVLGVPLGESGRLEHWPPLASTDYKVTGVSWKESCADVLLSSAGWVAITARRGMVCSICAHTPKGLGIDLRIPSLMPHSVRQKGPRKIDSPAYSPIKEHLFTKFSP